MNRQYREVCESIFSLGMYKKRFGVELMAGVLDLFSHPQCGLHIVHIAGTNGKGSTAFYTASILREAGYEAGLYTSPHLVEPTERIRINGRCVNEDEFAAAGEEVLRRVRKAGLEATASDILLMMALLLFQRHGCEYAVIETGLGGSLDSTNALTGPALIRKPDEASLEDAVSGKALPAEVTCITRIGLDHTALLGNTIQEIAESKAGIIKRGTGAVLAANAPAAMEILEAHCKSLGVKYCKVEDEKAVLSRLKERFPKSSGTYQMENMANALVIARCLGIEPETAGRGLEKTVIPGRLQRLKRTDGSGWLLLDGAHNPQGAKALADSIKALYPGKRFDCVMGMVRDKDVKGIMQSMLPLMERVCLVPVGPTERRLSLKEPEDFLKTRQIPVKRCEDLREALILTRDREMTLVFGSLYLTGEVLHEFSDTNRSIDSFGAASECDKG